MKSGKSYFRILCTDRTTHYFQAGKPEKNCHSSAINRECMYAYALLEPGCYYLIQENKEEPISLIRVNVETDHCLFVSRFTDQELVEWKRKSDPIHDIIELLSDEAVAAWEASYNARFDLEEEDDDYGE